MADEPRRSGRATKGQHTKNHDEPDAAQNTKRQKGKGKVKKAEAVASENEEEEDDAIVRCICGATEDEDGSMMICCDKCAAWQHNLCMGITENEDELPEQYLCEQCGPKRHKETLSAIARGERPWEDRAKEKAESERKGRRRKSGKKGKATKSSRPSDAKTESDVEMADTAMDVKSASPAVKSPEPAVTLKVEKNGHSEPTPTIKPDPNRPAAEKRRKSSHHEADGASSKRRKSSTIPDAVASPPVMAQRIEDLPADRQRVAQHILKELSSGIAQAFKDGHAAGRQQQNAADTSTALALQIEFALTKAYTPVGGTAPAHKETYKEKFRTITFNLKKNPRLTEQLVAQTLAPEQLVNMTSEEMADEKLIREKAKMKQEAEKQHILVKEEGGRRVRKTHKGDEIIEDGNDQQAQGATNFARTKSPRRGSVQQSSTRGSSVVNSPLHAGSPLVDQKPNFPSDGVVPVIAKSPESKHKSSTDWNSYQYTDRPFPEISDDAERQLSESQARATPGNVEHDAEIDRLLGDDEEEEPPYSPVEYGEDPLVVWKGKIHLPYAARPSAVLRHVAGRDLSERFPWADLLSGELELSGRIARDLADGYVASMRHSPTTDVALLQVRAGNSPQDQTGLDRIYYYFITKDRWGVVSRVNHPAVRDLYLIPLPAGSDPPPSFINMLLFEDQSVIEVPRPENSLLMVFIVRTASPVPSVRATPSLSSAGFATQGTSRQSSATLVHQGSTTPSAHSVGQAMSPLTAGPDTGTRGFLSRDSVGASSAATVGSQSTLANHEGPSDHSGATYQPSNRAVELLGPYVSTPVVGAILSAVQNMPDDSLKNLRDILEKVPECRTDLSRLQIELNRNGTG